MVGTLQPLADKFPIIGADGKPTPYFIRWAQQRQMDIGNAISQEALEAFLADHQIQAGPGITVTPDGSIVSKPTISLHASIGDLLDVDTTTTPPTDGQVLTWVDADSKWEPKTPTGGGGISYTPPTKRGYVCTVFNARSVTLNFPTGTVAGDLAVVWVNNGWGASNPSGWTVLDNQIGSNTNGATFFKILSAGDITTGSMTVSFANSYWGAAGMEVYETGTYTGISLAGATRTGGTTPTVSFSVTLTPADNLAVYGGTRANTTPSFLLATVDDVQSGSDASAAVGTYQPTSVSLAAETITYPSSGGGVYAAAVVVAGVTTGGGGGGAVSARYWRLMGVRAAPSHDTDGLGLVNIQWQDGSGTNLVGSGTPSASNTDGAWNLAQGYQSNMGSGKGWYSANGGVNAFCFSWTAYDFGSTVTPKKVAFAPLNGSTWTPGTMIAVDYSDDGELYKRLQIINVRTPVSSTLETYDLLEA